jgi:quinol-cytochrome oxidoreductase complex cytochrome b subunit
VTPGATDRNMALMRRVGVLLLTVEVAVLVVTGVLLFFVYRPETVPFTSAYATHRSLTFSQVLVRVHRWTAWAAVLTSIVTAVVLVAEAAVRWRGPLRRRNGVVTGPVILVTVIASFVTGLLLPWNQLALWAVTVGSNMRGYRPLFGDQVRFVLVGGTEVAARTILTWLFVHAALSVPLLAALGAPRTRRRASAPDLDPHGDTAAHGRDRQEPVLAATGVESAPACSTAIGPPPTGPSATTWPNATPR